MSSGKTSNPDGFTLLEVLVAVTILGMAYLAILQSFSVSLRSISKLDHKRQQIFNSLLEMEKHFPLADNEPQERENLPVFMKGQKYNLLLMTDEKNKLVTLKLEKR